MASFKKRGYIFQTIRAGKMDLVEMVVGRTSINLKKKKKKFNYLWFIRHKPKTWIEKKKKVKESKKIQGKY